ncbi:restriction endonuclease subunit S [Ramlibacter sp. AN1133]|uniref:restriction endonuclease subunit S n=1 Tax=Ramlibacter sp. AN1133 TaxID=3133429 RepID=UPI0030BCE34D
MKNGIYKPASEYADEGRPCLRMYNIDAGNIVWRDIRRMRVTEKEFSEYGLREGDLLVNRVNSRELVGKAAYIPASLEPSVFESKNIRVRLDTAKALPKFINYQLFARGSRYFANNAQQVVGMASISQGQLADFPIVLADTGEQQSIVAEIEKQFSRLDEAVANLRRVKSNLHRYERATIEGMTNPYSFKPSFVGTIAEIATSLDNRREPVNKRERAKRPGNIPYLGANGQTGWIDVPIFDEELVLVVEDETFVGRTAPFCYYFSGKCWVNNHTHVLRAKPEMVTAKYLNLALSYYPFIPLTTGSTGRRKLTKAALMAARIVVPSLKVQADIVAEVERRLSIVREVETEVDANLKRAQSLRQAILAKAFSGAPT